MDNPLLTALIGREDTFAASGSYKIFLDKFGLSGAKIAERTAALLKK